MIRNDEDVRYEFIIYVQKFINIKLIDTVIYVDQLTE